MARMHLIERSGVEGRAVTVISDTPAVYGLDCRSERYGPADPYIGVAIVDLARYQGQGPVELPITWLMPGHPMTDVRAPASGSTACPVQ